MKIQIRTTMLFTILTGTVFFILTATVYYFSKEFAYNDFYKRLELRARIAAKLAFEQDHVSTESFKKLQTDYLEKLPEEQTIIVKLDEGNNPVNPPGQVSKTYLQSIVFANGTTVYYQNKLRNYAGLFYKDETGDFIVIKSATNAYGSEVMERLRNILIITFIVSLIVIYSVGLYFSKKTFQPFRYINDRVHDISGGNLHLRLEEHAGTDEIAELTRTFNHMLDRLETAFEAQNNFISNASHEFRTPLTTIVAEADYALLKDREAEDYKTSLYNIVQQAEKLQHITKGLLSLAQTGFDGKRQSWDKIRLDQLLFAVKENINAIMPDNNIIIYLPDLPHDDADISCSGNYDLLKIALGNVVMNACKYSNNREVMVQLSIQNKWAVIDIADKGIGIPAEEIKYIYDPFFRASNALPFEGYGVGMPLSNNIIRLHKRRITIDSQVNKGTTVHIFLPVKLHS